MRHHQNFSDATDYLKQQALIATQNLPVTQTPNDMTQTSRKTVAGLWKSPAELNPA
jgi:hypothetical protein